MIWLSWVITNNCPKEFVGEQRSGPAGATFPSTSPVSALSALTSPTPLVA
jgi:hypothetical protein